MGRAVGREEHCLHIMGGWREGPRAGAAVWPPPEAMSGDGDAGQWQRGQQQTEGTAAPWHCGGGGRRLCRRTTLCYLGCALQHCLPACLDSTSACAKFVTGPFFCSPSVPYQPSPCLSTRQCCQETRLCLHHRPLLSPGQHLASLVTQGGKAELNRTKVNPNNKATDRSRRRRVTGITSHSEVSPR